jgi:hypothetical protein
MLSSSQITFPEYLPELFPAVRFLELALKLGLEPVIHFAVVMHTVGRFVMAPVAQVNRHAVFLAFLAVASTENMVLLYCPIAPA